METSAKTGYNVQEAFKEIAKYRFNKKFFIVFRKLIISNNGSKNEENPLILDMAKTNKGSWYFPSCCVFY